VTLQAVIASPYGMAVNLSNNEEFLAGLAGFHAPDGGFQAPGVGIHGPGVGPRTHLTAFGAGPGTGHGHETIFEWAAGGGPDGGGSRASQMLRATSFNAFFWLFFVLFTFIDPQGASHGELNQPSPRSTH